MRMLFPEQPNSGVFLGYNLIIFLHSWFGGFYSGLLAILLSIFAGAYFFAHPVNSIKIFDTSLIYSSIVFFLQSAIIAFLTSSFSNRLKKEVGVKKSLELKESMLKSVIDSVFGFMVLTDEKGRIIEYNSLYQSLQKNNEDLVGKSIFDTFPWKKNLILGASLRESYEKAYKDGSYRIDEQIKIDEEKSYYNINVSLIDIESQGNSKKIYAVSGLDITQRKIYEQSLESVQSNYQKLINSNIVGMVISDSKGIIHDANDAFLKLVGYKLEDFKKKNLTWNDITPSEYHHLEDKALKELLIKGYSGPLQKEFLSSSQERVPVLVAWVLINDNSEESLTIVVDISAQQKVINLKDEFIGIITHELKTPIMTLQGYIEILERDLEKSERKDLKKFIDIIGRQTERLNKLVSDLVDFIKLSKDKLVLNLENFDIVEFSKRISEEMSLLNTNHKINLESNFDSLFVHADPYRIEQVITNFLTNAIKFSPLDKEIVLKIEELEKQVRISVTDFGVGIPKEDIPKVFDKFFQSKGQPQPRQLNKSMGLGLYISSEIIKKHKGKIGVKCELNEGTTFFFTLPKSTTN